MKVVMDLKFMQSSTYPNSIENCYRLINHHGCSISGVQYHNTIFLIILEEQFQNNSSGYVEGSVLTAADEDLSKSI